MVKYNFENNSIINIYNCKFIIKFINKIALSNLKEIYIGYKKLKKMKY